MKRRIVPFALLLIGGFASAPAAQEEVRKVGGDVKPPKLVHRVDAKYPDSMRAARKSGLVVLRLTVDKQGNVVNPAVERRSEQDFEAAALEAVRQWLYEPATADGKPVAVYLTVTISFNIK